MKYALKRVCEAVQTVFSSKRLNQIMCGMATFPVCLWSLAEYIAFGHAATEHTQAFATQMAVVCALPWIIELAILLNLRERPIKASRDGIEIGSNGPSSQA